MRSKNIWFSFSVVIITAAYRRQNRCLLLPGYNSTLCNKSFEEKCDRKDTNGNFIRYRNGLKVPFPTWWMPIFRVEGKNKDAAIVSTTASLFGESEGIRTYLPNNSYGQPDKIIVN